MQPALLILIRGLPGSGKTYIARALQQQLGDVVMLDPDAIDYESDAYKKHVEEQLAEGVDPKLHAYRYSRAQAYAGIEAGKIIMWNQPFTNLEIFEKMIARMQEHAAEHDAPLEILIIEVNTDPKIAEYRVNQRKAEGGHGPSADTFQRFVNDYVTFDHLGFKTVKVDGTAPADESATAIAATVHELRK